MFCVGCDACTPVFMFSVYYGECTLVLVFCVDCGRALRSLCFVWVVGVHPGPCVLRALCGVHSDPELNHVLSQNLAVA